MLRNPTTFSFQDIAKWKTDITQLPLQINEAAIKLADFASEHTQLTKQKDELTTQTIAPQQERVDAIYWKLAILENPGKIENALSQINSYARQLTAQHASLQELQTRIGVLREKINSFESAETLLRLQKDSASLRLKLNRIAAEITEHSQQQVAFSNALQLLNARLNAALSEQQRLNVMPAGGYASTQTPSGGYTSQQHPNHTKLQVMQTTIDGLRRQIQNNQDEARRNTDCLQSLQRDLNATENTLASNQIQEHRIGDLLSKLNLRLPSSLDSVLATLTEDRKALNGLEWNEKNLNNEIRNNELEKKRLEEHADYLDKECKNAQMHLNAYFGPLKNCLTDDTYTLNNLNTLKSFYSSETDILKKHKTSRDQLISSIQRNLLSQEGVRRNKAAQEERLQTLHADKFMSDFNGEDTIKLQMMLDNLSQKLIAALDQYAKDHPRIDDADIRSRLREYSSRVDFILSNNRQFNEAPQDIRDRFIHLSGYIWTLTDNINDKTFKQTILDVLDKSAIAQADSTREFIKLRDNHLAQLYRITPEHLKASEAEDYRNAYNNLKETLAKQPKNAEYYVRYLFSTGKNLLDIVNDNNYSFDHSTKILNAARELIIDFKSPANHQNLANLLNENLHGKRSIPKIVFGAVLMVLGAATFAVCLALGILSLGILSAPATIGMACGAAVFGAGMSLCINGRHKGVHKAIMNFQWAAEKADYHYATSPLSNHSYFQRPTAPPLEASAPAFTK